MERCINLIYICRQIDWTASRQPETVYKDMAGEQLKSVQCRDHSRMPRNLRLWWARGQ